MIKIKFKINSPEKEKRMAEHAERNRQLFEEMGICFTISQDTKREYDRKKYKNFLTKIRNEWAIENKKFLERVNFLLGKKGSLDIKVNITQYGPAGFYNVNANDIFVNRRADVNFVRLIKHEVLHILVEPYIKKFKINQKNKESLVNSLLNVLEF